MGLKSLFGKLKEGLQKTTAALGQRVRQVLAVFKGLDEATLGQIEETLLAADIGVVAVEEILGNLRARHREGKIARSEDVLALIKSDLRARLGAAPPGLAFAPRPPTVLLVVGVNGSGKTTSIAKLAKALQADGKKVLLAAADTFRAAAIDQLGIWSQRLGVELVHHQPGADPAAVAFDACDAALARKADVLIVDTAGRLQTKINLMRELEKIRNVVARKIPGAPTRRSSSSTRRSARTRSRRRSTSTRRRRSPASSWPSSTGRRRAGSWSRSTTSSGSRSSSSAWGKSSTTSSRSTRAGSWTRSSSRQGDNTASNRQFRQLSPRAL
jgi:fused signal recognition particle receptor